MKIIHTHEDCIREFGEPPICGCDECQKNGTKVNINPRYYNKYMRNGYPKFINGHQNIGHKHKEISKQNMSKSHKYRHHSPSTEFKKGQHPSIKTEFKKDICPKGKDNNLYGKTYHGKKIFSHSTPLQGLILMHRWDRKYAQYLDLNNIEYLYEPQAFELILNNKYTNYIPDFFLIETNEYIEVKGYFRGDAKEKYELFLKTYPEIKIKLLMKNNLQELGIDLRFILEERELLDNYNKQKN